MADHIPFVTSEEGMTLVNKHYADSVCVKIPLDKANKYACLKPSSSKLWLDCTADGLDDLETRRPRSDRKNTWFEFMSKISNFEEIADPSNHVKPSKKMVGDFVTELLDKCLPYNPAWITVPQLPILKGIERNKINRCLAEAAGSWKSKKSFSGSMILPVILMHQDCINKKMSRNVKVKQADQCYSDSRSDGFWVVDKTLTDDSGSQTLKLTRFPGIISFHEELNASISSSIKIGGPYWALNLVMWARGLIDFPAIGIGSGYQHFISGGMVNNPSVRLCIPSLRRRVGVSPELKAWIDVSISRIPATHPAHKELAFMKKNYAFLTTPNIARDQVADSYKKWFSQIEAVPVAGRPLAMYQDFSLVYAFGRSLTELKNEGTARRPEAIAESLLLSCL